MKTRSSIVAILLMACATAAFAGGPLLIFDEATRTPYAYPPGVVDVYTDLGDNGLFTNAQANGQVAFGFAEWTNVSSAYFSAAVAGDFASIGLPDIDGFNAGLVVGTYNGDGIHVMYDDDGSIVSFFFGAPPGVLGIASPDFSATGTSDLLESWAVINGSAADLGDTGSTYQGVYTHEFGHSINLAHTQTVGAAGFFGDQIGPDACATPYPGGISLDDFETMYPFLDITPGSTGDFQATVDHADDIAALSTIYPDAGFPGTHGTITGIVYGPDGITELTGINVIARPLSDPFKGAVSALSGDFTQGALGPDGLFTLNGLTPGEDYVLYIDEIVAGGFSTSPQSITGDGDEEYWNASESADPGVDDPCDFTLITPVAGVPATADIIVNGNPNALDLGDDDFIEVSLPWPFPFCGQTYNSVFVGSNGFLTFGGGDTDFTESVSDFLDNEPRIAMWWDDLSPNQGGSVTAMPDGADFVVRFDGVPQFVAGDDNTFECRLRADGTYDIEYINLDSSDGIVGRTMGGGVPDPGEIDISATPPPIGAGLETVYEDFRFDGDLSGLFTAWGACVIPDPPFITVDPASLCAGPLLEGEMETQTLQIQNLGDEDLTFGILTNQDLGAAANGVIPKLDLSGNGDPGVLDEVRLARYNEDLAGSSTDKPEQSPFKVDLPHHFALPLLMEDFNSGFPAGWVAIDNAGFGVEWQVPAQGGGNFTGGSGDAAGANNDFVGSVDDVDCELRTPPISGFGPNVVLSYTANYQNFANFDFLDVDISTDGGANWTTVLSWNEDHGGFFGPPGEQVALNLDPFLAGATEFIVRWRYYDPTDFDFDWYAQIDDVMIVSDEPVVPCDFLTVSPTNGTVGADMAQDIDVTFDATGFAPGTYECEIIISSNAVNEPRIVVPVCMIVAQEVTLDIKPGSCPNPINRKLFDWAEGSNPRKGGVIPMAIAGTDAFDVGTIDVSTVLLNGVAPLDKPGPKYEDVATAWDNSECNCTEATSDGYTDLSLKFRGLDVAQVLMDMGHRSTQVVEIVAQLNDGTYILGRDCFTFVGNSDNEQPDIANEYVLGVNTPNPFNPITRINYSIPEAGPVKVTVFDVQGRVVTELVNGVRSAGEHSLTWDAQGLASGIYFYRLESGNFTQTRKMILLK